MTVAVTELAVMSNWKPEGALRIMVPVPIAFFATSATTGPVSDV